MKLFIIVDNPVVPYLIESLKNYYDIKVDLNDYTKNLDVEKLTISDLTLKTNFADAILLLNIKKINQKIHLVDGCKTLNESIFELYKQSLWFTININDKLNYLIDKYDLKHYNLSNTTPFYITSKLALSEIILQKILQNSQKLLHQQKVLVLGYSDTSKILCDQLSANRMIVIVSDRLLQELVDAKQDGYGIILKEEINNTPIHFDCIIIDDDYFIKTLKRGNNQHCLVIDYKEENKNDESFEYLYPYELICQHFSKLMAQNIASSLKKECFKYFKEA